MNGKNNVLFVNHRKNNSLNQISSSKIYIPPIEKKIHFYETKVKEFQDHSREKLKISNETFKKKITEKIQNLLLISKEKIKKLKANSLEKKVIIQNLELKDYKNIFSQNVKLNPHKINKNIVNPFKKLVINKDKTENKGFIHDKFSSIYLKNKSFSPTKKIINRIIKPVHKNILNTEAQPNETYSNCNIFVINYKTHDGINSCDITGNDFKKSKTKDFDRVKTEYSDLQYQNIKASNFEIVNEHDISLITRNNKHII